MSDTARYDRRQFLGAAALGAGVALCGPRSAIGAPSKLPTVAPGTHTSFPTPLKQINAGSLNIGYIEAGPAKGPPVVLLHGWPYDIYSFVDVTPLLVTAGYRVIVPYLRGNGPRNFLPADPPPNGHPAALAHDIVDLMD